MPTAYYVSVTIHVLAVMLWLGRMLFLGLVGAPVLFGLGIVTAALFLARGG